MSSPSQVLEVRTYAGQWLVCDLLREGRRYTYCHGQPKYSSGPEWLVRPEKQEEHWLRWLFDAPENVQNRHVIAADGSAVEWPDLGRHLSADELLDRHPFWSFQYKWKRRSLRNEASREELINCWVDQDKWQWFDLRDDGTCAMKMASKGGSKGGTGPDAVGTFTWHVEGPRKFEVEQRYPEPHVLKDAQLAQELGMPPVHGVRTTYEIMRFDGKIMELLEIRDNGFAVLGPIPIWWEKAKRPRAWRAAV